jgi:predicted methyltransferase
MVESQFVPGSPGRRSAAFANRRRNAQAGPYHAAESALCRDEGTRMASFRLSAALFAAAFLAACAGPQPLPQDRIAAIVASPDRSAADRINDVRRKPAEMLAFIGVRPGMVAMDVSAARGYTTELIARAVGPAGKVYGQSAPRAEGRAPPAQREGAAAPPPAGPPPANPAPTLAERARQPATPNIVVVSRPFEDPAPPEVANGGLDLVTLMFNYHDFGHMGVDRAKANAAIFRALKPGGIYVIADHSGRAGTGISESGTLHRVEEAFVKQEVEAAGFRLQAQGNFMRNPADPRDRNTPEPAMPKDEFVLKFVKP